MSTVFQARHAEGLGRVAHKKAVKRGDQIDSWLKEKLSPGQFDKGHVWSGDQVRGRHYCVYDDNTIRFHLRNVSYKYWIELIRPGCEDLAKRLGCKFRFNRVEPFTWITFDALDDVGARVE